MWARHVTRPFDEDLRERVRELQTTEAFKKALRKRQVWVEPLFGEAKDWYQLRRFLLPWWRVRDSGLRPDPHGLRGLDNGQHAGVAGRNRTEPEALVSGNDTRGSAPGGATRSGA
jgi:hypothetical protein